MSYVLAFLGFAALIILHEAGHFAAAKAVGMRVERFSLFFGPMLLKFRKGETEYGIGPIPLGGYVRITGMNPNEEIPPEVVDRAYFRQPVWKRIVVILAGPAVNILIAFLILWGLLVFHGTYGTADRVARGSLEAPAKGVLEPGDRIVSVDGKRLAPADVGKQIATHTCAGTPVRGCRATTTAVVTVRRNGETITFRLRPRYDPSAKRTRIGFAFAYGPLHKDGPISGIGGSASQMWDVTSRTFTAFSKIVSDRKQISGVVGSYKVTQESFSFSVAQALYILAVISLSLAIVNLFPFLPLDGGHVFWALAEKVRGRPIPFSVMERASVVGFVLVLGLFFIGLTNDIDRLTGQGFAVR